MTSFAGRGPLANCSRNHSAASLRSSGAGPRLRAARARSRRRPARITGSRSQHTTGASFGPCGTIANASPPTSGAMLLLSGSISRRVWSASSRADNPRRTRRRDEREAAHRAIHRRAFALPKMAHGNNRHSQLRRQIGQRSQHAAHFGIFVAIGFAEIGANRVDDDGPRLIGCSGRRRGSSPGRSPD